MKLRHLAATAVLLTSLPASATPESGPPQWPGRLLRAAEANAMEYAGAVAAYQNVAVIQDNGLVITCGPIKTYARGLPEKKIRNQYINGSDFGVGAIDCGSNDPSPPPALSTYRVDLTLDFQIYKPQPTIPITWAWEDIEDQPDKGPSSARFSKSCGSVMGSVPACVVQGEYEMPVPYYVDEFDVEHESPMGDYVHRALYTVQVIRPQVAISWLIPSPNVWMLRCPHDGGDLVSPFEEFCHPGLPV